MKRLHNPGDTVRVSTKFGKHVLHVLLENIGITFQNHVVICLYGVSRS